MLIVMAGLPGTGKSTVCRELAKTLPATILDKDKIRAALFPPKKIQYSTEQDDFCMKIMLETAAYLLRKDAAHFVFLDGRPFSRRYQIEEAIATAEELKQPWRILDCTCSDETARQRIEAQAAGGEHLASNRDYALYLRVKTAFEEIIQPKTIVNTDQPLEATIPLALNALR